MYPPGKQLFFNIKQLIMLKSELIPLDGKHLPINSIVVNVNHKSKWDSVQQNRACGVIILSL